MKKIILFLIFSFFAFSDNLIIQYLNLKKIYYNNQIINLNIKVITPNENNLTFIKPVNSELNVTKTSPLIYNLQLVYQNNNDDNKLIIIGKNIYKEITLNNLYQTKPLEKIPKFCNVLADELKIKNFIASKYNDKYNLLSFTISAKNANLNDFSLNLKDENLTLISNNQATYLGLIPNDKKTLIFYYFNTKNDNFQKVDFPINIKEETISTQTNLNPEENKLFTPINILLLVITAFFIIVFLVYQKIWLLIFPVGIIAFVIYNHLPKGEVTLKKGTKVYILPTKNSTVFYIAPFKTKVKILKKLKHYTKIEINNKIGWIKNDYTK